MADTGRKLVVWFPWGIGDNLCRTYNCWAFWSMLYSDLQKRMENKASVCSVLWIGCDNVGSREVDYGVNRGWRMKRETIQQLIRKWHRKERLEQQESEERWPKEQKSTKARAMLEGSYTQEATFVFPLYIMLLVGFLLIGFFLYDKVVLTMTAQYYAKAALHMVDEPVSVEGEMEPWRLEEQGLLWLKGYSESFSGDTIRAECQKQMEERMFMAELKEVECTYHNGEVTISYDACYQAPVISDVLSFLGVETDMEGEATASRAMSPEEFVRIVRGVIWRNSRTVKKNENPSEGQTLNQEDSGG